MIDLPMREDQETIREFLVESFENLSRLDQELVELETHPHDASLLGSIFRTFHTIKGACGFLAFSTLETISHQAENLLSQLRDGKRELDSEFVSLILETVDATREVLASIEASGTEGNLPLESLTERLRNAAQLNTAIEREPVLTSTPQPELLQSSAAGSENRNILNAKEKTPPRIHALEDARREQRQSEDEELARPAAADTTIRVGVPLLDKLMDLVGELVLTRNQILQFNLEREDAALNATSQRLNLITSELQEGVMKTRMQPIGVVWNNLPRVVRDMAVHLSKQIQLKMDGSDTELDRTILEAIKDPLIHLVRNSCDHGIELPEVRVASGKPPQGTMTLRAYHEGGQVNIEISDDGAGIDIPRVKHKAVENGLLRPEQVEKLSDREVINLIFLPGFSTMHVVTNLSGRGVGMDVVKSHIEKIGGGVDIFSRSGEGTTVKIRIPLTLAIIPGLVVTSGGERFVIPQVSLLELIRLNEDSCDKRIEYVHGTPVYRRRGNLLPIAYLNDVLGLTARDKEQSASMVVLQAEDRQFGLVVDGINDTQEIVVKPLGKQLKGLTLYAGATIMGDGRVALILDVLGIGQHSGVFGEAREQSRVAVKEAVQSDIKTQRLLLFRAGLYERLAIPLSLVARLEEFPLSAIEYAGGGQVVQYRDHILPLVSLRSVLEPDAPHSCNSPNPVQVVVFNEGDRSVGMVVDQILDVAEEAVTVRQQSSRKGLLGSAVVGKLVTDFLDLSEVVNATSGKWFAAADGRADGKNILVMEGSAFSRGMIRGGLDMAGYSVVEAANLDEAKCRLEERPMDLLIAALDIKSDGRSALMDALGSRPDWAKIPALALADECVQDQVIAAQAAGFQDCQAKFDGVRILESATKLISPLAAVHAGPVCAGEAR